jgi:hypothetical protein
MGHWMQGSRVSVYGEKSMSLTKMIIIAFTAMASVPSLAATVEYTWVDQSSTGNSGEMTFTLPATAPNAPNDFSGATLTSFVFDFSNGTVATLGTSGLAVTSLSAAGWSAGTNGTTSSGYLTSVAEITNSGTSFTPPTFTFQFQEYAGQSTGIDAAVSGTLADYGVWKEVIPSVPLPSSWPLIVAGLGALGAASRRNRLIRSKPGAAA